MCVSMVEFFCSVPVSHFGLLIVYLMLVINCQLKIPQVGDLSDYRTKNLVIVVEDRSCNKAATVHKYILISDNKYYI